jgi:hypothetical protein
MDKEEGVQVIPATSPSAMDAGQAPSLKGEGRQIALLLMLYFLQVSAAADVARLRRVWCPHRRPAWQHRILCT